MTKKMFEARRQYHVAFPFLNILNDARPGEQFTSREKLQRRLLATVESDTSRPMSLSKSSSTFILIFSQTLLLRRVHAVSVNRVVCLKIEMARLESDSSSEQQADRERELGGKT